MSNEQTNTITKNNFSSSSNLKKYGTLYALIAIVVLNCIITPNFMAINTFWNLSIQVLPTILTAIGMTFVISSGGIDISVGSVMAISAVMSGMVITEMIPALGTSVPMAVIFALLIAAVLGFLNGVIITVFKIQPIIVTLILYIAGRGIAQLMNNGGTIVFSNNAFTKIGLMRIGGVVPIQLVVIVIFVFATYYIFKNTKFGYYVQAIGENGEASRFSGINTTKVLICVYVISSVLAGLAGVFEASRASCADPNSIGAIAEMDAIAAVAVGGTSINGGKAMVMGTILGALIIQLITITVNMNNIPFAYSRIFKAVIIIVAVYAQREKRKS